MAFRIWDGTSWLPFDDDIKHKRDSISIPWATRFRPMVYNAKNKWLPEVRSTNDYSITVQWDVAGRTPPPIDPEVPVVPKHPVPSLLGLTFAQAVTALQAVNLNVGNVSYINTSDLTKDDLIQSQSLAPLLQVEEGVNVDVVIYEYKTPQIVMPQIGGLLKTAAETQLKTLGFVISGTLNTVETYDTTLIGKVIPGSQYPYAGETWDLNTIASFDYYVQKAKVTMPKLIGLKESDVWSALYNVGLDQGTVSEVETTTKTLQGLVKSQQYNEGQQLEVGTLVNYTVYIPNTTIQVPVSLIGKNVAQFEAALAAVELYPGTRTEFETTTQSLEGTIKTVNPASGSTVAVNSAVDYTIYVPNTTTVVPTINGKTIAQAVSTLTTAELQLGWKYGDIETSNTALHNTITQQTPSAGQTVSVNSSVDYYVYIPIKTAVVPNIVGYATSTASTVLSNAGFYLGSQTGTTTTTNASLVGKIVSYSPSGTQNLNTGINYTVYVEDPKATVPNLVGLSESSARTALTNVGLNMGTVTYADAGTTGANTVGNVYSQAYSSGTQLLKGTSVNVFVWKAHVYVTTTVNKTAQNTIAAGLIPINSYYGSGSKRPDESYTIGQWTGTTNGNQVCFVNFKDSLISASRSAAGAPSTAVIDKVVLNYTVAASGNSSKQMYLGYYSEIYLTGEPGTLNLGSIVRGTQGLGLKYTNSSYSDPLNSSMVTQCFNTPTYPLLFTAPSTSAAYYATVSNVSATITWKWTETTTV